jgi:hypothetical protein
LRREYRQRRYRLIGSKLRDFSAQSGQPGSQKANFDSGLDQILAGGSRTTGAARLSK